MPKYVVERELAGIAKSDPVTPERAGPSSPMRRRCNRSSRCMTRPGLRSIAAS